MQGSIHRDHGLGKYNVDLSSRYESESLDDEQERLDEKIADIDRQIAENEAEAAVIESDLDILRPIVSSITAQRQIAQEMNYYNETLNEMPEGPERDALEARKEHLEEYIEEEDIVAQLAAIDAQIAEMTARWEEMEESPEKDELENEIDCLMDDGVDVGAPIEELEDINIQLEEKEEGAERDWIEEEIERLQEELDILEAGFEDLKDDLRDLDLGIDVELSLDELYGPVVKVQQEKAYELQKLRKLIDLLELQKTALEKRDETVQERLDETVEVLIYNVWCADLTEDLSGSVGILGVSKTEDFEYSEDLDSESEALNDEIDRLDEKIADVNAQIAEKTAEIATLTDEIDAIVIDITLLIGQIESAEGAIADIEERLNEIEIRKLEIEEDIFDLTETITGYRLGDESGNIEEFGYELGIALIDEILNEVEPGYYRDELLDRAARIEREFAGFDQDAYMADVLAQMDALRALAEGMPEGPELDALEEEWNTLRDEHDEVYELTLELEDLYLKLNELPPGELRDILESARADLVEWIAEARAEIVVLETEEAELEIEETELGVDKTDLEATLEDLNDQRRDLRKQQEDLQSQKNKLLSDIDTLELKKAAFEVRKAKIENDRKYETKDSIDEIDALDAVKSFNIQPGYEGNAAYDDVRDAIPSPDTYKYGIIRAIDYDLDTCTVEVNPFLT